MENNLSVFFPSLSNMSRNELIMFSSSTNSTEKIVKKDKDAEYKCLPLKNVSESLSSQLQHRCSIREDRGGQLECLPCGKKFTGEASMQEHMRSEKHLKTVNKSSLLVPLISSQSHKSSSSDTSSDCLEFMFECQPCGKKFNSIESKKQHDESSKHLKLISQGLTHQSDSFTSQILTLCSIENKNSNNISGVGQIECNPCGKIFSGDVSLQEHLKSEKHLRIIRNKNLDIPILRPSLNQTSSRTDDFSNDFECKPCGKKFSGIESKKQHDASEKHLKKLNILRVAY